MKNYIVLILSSICLQLYSQTPDSIVQATEFTIPLSGAFTLLGNTPAEVTTPGFTKDVSFDVFLNKFSLKPNIAFEIQPFWLFGYKNVTLTGYQSKSIIERFLSTGSVSIGTIQANDSINRFAYSLKFSLFHDPMMDTSYITGVDGILQSSRVTRSDLESDVSRRKFAFKLRRAALIVQKDTGSNTNRINEILNELNDIEKSIDSLNFTLINNDISFNKKLSDAISKFVKEYMEANWYRSKMDIGFGKVYTYADPDVSKIKLNHTGFGFWFNPSIGCIPAKIFNRNADSKKAAKLLLTGIYKNIKTDSLNQEYYGGNIKYGSVFLNVFVEYIYSNVGSNSKIQTMAYGGSYTMGTNKIIQFGLRTDYDAHFKFLKLRPVISLNLGLGKDLFK